MKNCVACNTIKPINDFGKKAASKDGLDCYCCVCRDFSWGVFVL